MSSVAHLSVERRINIGSFYTPKHIVDRLYDMLNALIASDDIDILLEPSCGYGAFFDHCYTKTIRRIIGVDIDSEAIKVAKERFENVEFLQKNALRNAVRSSYDIKDSESLVIVGNPPYNDITSQIKRRIKSAENNLIDDDLITRDIGLSSLLAYNKLKADVIAILHPLSYLVKKTNFGILRPLTRNYRLKDALVFNSQEFTGTSRLNGFPLIIALYRRDKNGMTYDDIFKWRFKTLEGESFCLSQFDYIGNYLDKYPNKQKRGAKYFFYTMRDINALKRSSTFIKEKIANAVYVSEEKLDYYCYVDIFKDYASRLPYYMGNLDVPINNNHFTPIRECFRIASVSKHSDIFGGSIAKPTAGILQKAKTHIETYFNLLFCKEKQ